MQLGRINSFYDIKYTQENQLLTESITTKTLFYTHDFDNRISFFSSLLNSSLFKDTYISREDLQFWFPECLSLQKKSSHSHIKKEQILQSIECFLAEIMEDEIG